MDNSFIICDLQMDGFNRSLHLITYLINQPFTIICIRRSSHLFNKLTNNQLIIKY